ncbi:proly 4-hydroxylase [Thecamonas trahens ATCC 50062]|uniref:Proly 4-hydroxylase n=1 Tax=Thecamonas trahens ATCC 50062 TaxID=461836 RepID=A0A0L0D6F2_THETB|nr:proly 4-hydroxylase [Thecamonas trahens ATCC 50062]KNC46893.1 proly 4-hydroxylase [Thecamonas trahens ATCC 50062]|eukprot:XP_013760166.1 proly 4-hydroxylase [Thecamonas trahens ATCC 50062]
MGSGQASPSSCASRPRTCPQPVPGGRLAAAIDPAAGQGPPTNVFMVPADEFFFWPGLYKGHRTTVAGIVGAGGAPVVIETVSLEPRVFILDNIISEEQMEVIKGAVRHEMQRSAMYTPTDDGTHYDEYSNGRTSSQAWYKQRHPLTEQLYDNIAALTKTRQNLAFGMQVINYGPAQHYEAHYDYFDPSMYPGESQFQNGRNRMITVLFYMNDVEEGGHTAFPRGDDYYGLNGVITDYSDCEHGVSVAPKKGRAVMFYSLKALGHMNGALDRYSLHSGCDVLKGEKWAANRWIWNKPFPQQ